MPDSKNILRWNDIHYIEDSPVLFKDTTKDVLSSIALDGFLHRRVCQYRRALFNKLDKKNFPNARDGMLTQRKQFQEMTVNGQDKAKRLSDILINDSNGIGIHEL